MKKSFVFYLRTTFLLLGAALNLIAGFTPVRSQLQFAGTGEFEGTVDVFEYGFDNSLWYVSFLGSLAVFLLGYLFNGLVNKILVYIFIPIFAFVFLFFTAVEFMPTGATPFVARMQYGYALLICGPALVIAATIISMHHGSKKRVIAETGDLLDS